MQKATIEFYKYGKLDNKNNYSVGADSEFISDDKVLKLCKNIDLEKMFELFFERHPNSHLETEYFCDEDDFFRTWITKEDGNFYVFCQDDYDDFYKESYTLSITNYLHGLRFCSSFMEDIDLIEDYNNSHMFETPILIADRIKEVLYNSDSNELAFDMDQCVADALDENIEFLIEWLRIKYKYPDKYEDFVKNFKELVQKTLYTNFIKVFNKNSKYMDGFTYIKLKDDLAINGERIFLNRVKNINKPGLKVVDLYDEIFSLLSIYSNKELTMQDDTLSKYSCGLRQNNHSYYFENYSNNQMENMDSLVFDSSTIFSVAFDIRYVDFYFRRKKISSKKLFVDFVFVPIHGKLNKLTTKDVKASELFYDFSIKIENAFFVYSKDEFEESTKGKIVL